MFGALEKLTSACLKLAGWRFSGGIQLLMHFAAPARGAHDKGSRVLSRRN
jgi:hypothetical protein